MENKIDRRKKYMIVLDTETCPMDNSVNQVSASNMLVYDIGWAVIDKKGHVYKTHSYIVSDIFFEKTLMNSAYYANKIPSYWKDIKNGSRFIKSLYHIRKSLLKDMEEYSVSEVYTHNAYFDLIALNQTQRWVTKSKYRYFFPYETIICDTLKMCKYVLKPQKTYQKFCAENNYITKNNQLRLTAEIVYRYISRDKDFIESHTALEDVMIEKEILAYCYRAHKKMVKELWSN